MTITKRQPIVYSGSGSAIDNYLKPAPVQEQKLENWASFSKLKPNPKKRSTLFSLLHQVQWTKPNTKHGEVPDLERLSAFLHSEKSPVKKRLIDMDDKEMSKLIACFNSMIVKKYK